MSNPVFDSSNSDNERTPPKKIKQEKRKQKYRKEWDMQTEFKGWLKPADDPTYASCSVCHVKFLADISVIKNHAKGSKYIKKAQYIFDTASQPKLSMLYGQHSQQLCNTKRAEIKLCGFLSEHNLPMRIMDHLIPLLRECFPDSKIAKEISMGRTKATNIIKNITGSFEANSIIETLKITKFSFLIDESTDVGSVKSICVCVRFFDKKSSQICTKYLELIECYNKNDAEAEGLANVGMTAENIYNKIMACFSTNQIPYSNIIGFGSDGCNTMFGEHNSVVSRLKLNFPGIMVQKCICHSLHLCASEACKVLPRHCEDLARNIYNFFNCSAKRQAQLLEFQHFCNVEPHKILKPAQTRWLSLLMVVNRILEQWNPLLLYFTNSMVEHRLQSSEMILNNLKNHETKLFFHFLQRVLPKFVHLNEYFQSERVILTSVYKKFCETYRDILLMYMIPQYVQKTSLYEIDPNNSEKFLPLNQMYLGVQILNNIEKLTENERQDFLYRCREFLKISCNEIRKRFDFSEESYMSKISIFDVLNSNEYKSIPTLFYLIKYFPRIIDPEDIKKIQAIDDQWRLFCNYKYPDEFRNEQLDSFWCKIGELKDGTGERKFYELSSFVLNVLSAPHSNASCERVF